MIQGKFRVVMAALIAASLLLVSCGGSSSGTHTSPSGSTDGTGGTGGTTSFMGSNTVLIGGSMSNETAVAAPFDVRYAYVHSQPAPSSDYYTASLCQAAWTGWWGCWSGTYNAPGYYVAYWDDYVAKATWQGSPRPQIYF